MHPAIRKFASKQFYEDRLKDSNYIIERPFPDYIARLQNKNMIFFDLPYSQERLVESSFENRDEAEFAVGFIERLLKKVEKAPAGGSLIGLITPYRQQVRLIKQLIPQNQFLVEKKGCIEINTIDSFQVPLSLSSRKLTIV